MLPATTGLWKRLTHCSPVVLTTEHTPISLTLSVASRKLPNEPQLPPCADCKHVNPGRAAWVPTISAIDLETPRREKKCTQPRRAGQQLQTVLDLGIPRRSNCCQAFPLLIDLHKRERDVGNQQQPPPPPLGMPIATLRACERSV